MDCQRIQDHEIAARYVAGELEEPDLEEFERHFFECQSCWKRLETVAALRDVLEADRATVEAGARRAVVRPWVWAWAAGLAAAALGVGIFLRSTPPAPDTAASQPGQRDATSLMALARVDPPRYVPMTFRSAGDVPHPGFSEAMEQYARQNYRGAARDLRAVAAQHADVSEVRFFLGVSELMAGETEAAIVDLRAAADLGHPLYSSSARFYLAKAYLSKGDVTASRAELEAVTGTGGALAAEARQILETLEEIERQP